MAKFIAKITASVQRSVIINKNTKQIQGITTQADYCYKQCSNNGKTHQNSENPARKYLKKWWVLIQLQSLLITVMHAKMHFDLSWLDLFFMVYTFGAYLALFTHNLQNFEYIFLRSIAYKKAYNIIVAIHIHIQNTNKLNSQFRR